MTYRLKDAFRLKLRECIPRHTGLSLLLSPAIKSQTLPRHLMSNLPRLCSNAHRVMRTTACSFRLRKTKAFFSCEDWATRSDLAPCQSVSQTAYARRVSVGRVITQKALAGSQGSGTICELFYGVAGETLCSSAEFFS